MVCSTTSTYEPALLSFIHLRCLNIFCSRITDVTKWIISDEMLCFCADALMNYKNSFWAFSIFRSVAVNDVSANLTV